jgi:multicomponent Na+:H+ antiporter subunit D
VYALLRVFTLLFDQDAGFTYPLILGIAALTMVAGVLGAVAERDVRRILSFHIISQIGYMVMGLGLFTAFSVAASIFYVAHHILVKTALFLVGGVMGRMSGSYELDHIGGLAGRSTALSLLFAVPALSLAGIPPFSGFFAKLGLIQAGIDQAQYLVVGVAIAVGFLTLLSMAKIWTDGFWGAPLPLVDGARAQAGRLLPPIAMLASLTIIVGFGAEPVFAIAQRAADGLMDPSAYIDAVLGPGAAEAGRSAP